MFTGVNSGIPHLPSGRLTPEDHYRQRARVEVAAGVLFVDSSQRVLLVKPNYKPYWDIPGGGCEAEESPADCAAREVREELGLVIKPGRLLCVDYRSEAQGSRGDSLRFVFDGGRLTPATIENITLCEDELVSWEFVARENLMQYLPSRLYLRVESCFGNPMGGAYLEAGKPRANDEPADR